jgi:predicted short-subunit dehydrogenase-like oxidoreductase (DUF2520 family)
VAAEDIRDPLSVSPPVAVVGGGAVAQTLRSALRQRGVPVSMVSSRAPSLPGAASTVIIAVADDAIESVARALVPHMTSGVALHTCGARGPEALEPLRSNGVAAGVLHPLQSIPSPGNAATLDGITYGIAGDPPALDAAERIVRLLGGHPVSIAPGRFPQYHAAAVMASNHVVALIDAAVALLAQAGLSPREALNALGPLCRVTVANVLAHGTEAALTGPVARGDAGTIRAHIEAMADAPPSVVELYRAASHRLVDVAQRRGLAADRRQALTAALKP